MAKMLLFKVGAKKPIEVEVDGLKDLYKFLECRTVEPVTIANLDNDNSLTLWIDEEGILVSKPINRGYAGHILASRTNGKGEDVDLTSEDAVLVKRYFEIKDKQSISKKISNFIETYDGEHYIFDYSFEGKMAIYITVSSVEVLSAIQGIDDKETIFLIEQSLDLLYMGYISERDFFKPFADFIGKMKGLEAKRKYA